MVTLESQLSSKATLAMAAETKTAELTGELDSMVSQVSSLEAVRIAAFASSSPAAAAAWHLLCACSWANRPPPSSMHSNVPAPQELASKTVSAADVMQRAANQQRVVRILKPCRLTIHSGAATELP